MRLVSPPSHPHTSLLDSMQFGFSQRLFVSLALVSFFARADYFIDDQNSTFLVYSESSSGATWEPFPVDGETLSLTLNNGTTMNVGTSQCYNHTFTYAPCTFVDDCQVQIPFTGSGITIYILQAGTRGVRATLMIDGGALQQNVLPAPPGPDYYAPNIVLFSIQGITTGNHLATMSVWGWDDGCSGLMFDYALINETIVTSTVSSGTPSSSTTTGSPTNKSSNSSISTSNIGIIVGCTVGGGVAILSAIAVAAFYCRQKRRSKPPSLSLNLDAEPKIEPFFSTDPLYYLPTMQHTDPDPTKEALVTSPVESTCVSPHSPTSAPNTFRRQKSLLGVVNAARNTVEILNPPVASVSSPQTALGASEASSSTLHAQETHSMLSDDQADFINSLYTNSVPAGAIARVIDRMMTGERQPVVNGNGNGPFPPPSYNHFTKQ